MQEVDIKMGVFTGVTEELNGMEPTTEKAMKFGAKQIATVRATISRLHKNTQKRFRTKKNEQDLLVWRIE